MLASHPTLKAMIAHALKFFLFGTIPCLSSALVPNATGTCQTPSAIEDVTNLLQASSQIRIGQESSRLSPPAGARDNKDEEVPFGLEGIDNHAPVNLEALGPLASPQKKNKFNLLGIDGSQPVDLQVLGLAGQVYKKCPEPGQEDEWKTLGGWELVVCADTRPKRLAFDIDNAHRNTLKAHDNVALFIHKDESASIEKGTCVLAFEGTQEIGLKNWLSDIKVMNGPLKGFGFADWCGSKVHMGFLKELRQFIGDWGSGDPSTEQKSSASFDQVKATIVSKCSKTWVTGHSLGGAMAEMFAYCANRISAQTPLETVEHFLKPGATFKHNPSFVVEAIYTIGAPAAFSTPVPENEKSEAAEHSAAKGCFGGTRFFNQDTKGKQQLDPVPILANCVGLTHASYDAVQLDADGTRKKTLCQPVTNPHPAPEQPCNVQPKGSWGNPLSSSYNKEIGILRWNPWLHKKDEYYKRLGLEPLAPFFTSNDEGSDEEFIRSVEKFEQEVASDPKAAEAEQRAAGEEQGIIAQGAASDGAVPAHWGNNDQDEAPGSSEGVVPAKSTGRRAQIKAAVKTAGKRLGLGKK